MLELPTEREYAVAARTRTIDLLRAWLSTSTLFLSGLFLPFGGPVLMLLTPQPGLRFGQRWAMGPLVALVLLVAATAGFAGGVGAAIAYLVSFGLLTLALPAVLRREWSIEVTVGLATAIVSTTVVASALSVASPAQLLSGLYAVLEEVREEALGVYGRAGLAPDVVRELREGSVRIVDVVAHLAPALMMMMIGASVLVNLLLLRWRQRVLGEAPVFGDLTRWKCPAELIWVLIASGYGMLLPASPVQAWALNVFGVILAVYFCQGLVIAQFYMRRWHSPVWVSGLIYVFILVEWVLATGVTLLGVFDQWADFRRLNPSPVEDD
jgi:uncharacterized protein YybS (DUF2232 family)